MHRTTSHRSGGGSSRSTNRKSPSPSPPPPPPRDQSKKNVRKTGILKVVAENPLVIVAVRGCFMCVTVNGLVQRLGVNPKIVEVEEVKKIAILVKLSQIEGSDGGPWELPAVYVGGKLLGGVDKVMEAHVKGEFVPMLRAAGALWL
ncbi:monothiol glutaredoxin-S9-like [Solanum pennellii]|uniref:Monothiol glutaredoxin-S9-like n=1 Tax=Solanum pennellii TaxID=28526 RepID=A0ABM1G1X6_SOLPN|nr:monothiol glutaredoxin-S9-like [Solanum pennellii]